MDLTPAFTRTQDHQKNSLEGQVFQGGLLQGFKWSLCQLVQHQREVPGGDAPPALRSVSMETIQETSEVLIFADIYSGIAQFVSNN